MLNPRNLTNGQEQYDHNVDYCGFEEKMKMLTSPVEKSSAGVIDGDPEEE